MAHRKDTISNISYSEYSAENPRKRKYQLKEEEKRPETQTAKNSRVSGNIPLKQKYLHIVHLPCESERAEREGERGGQTTIETQFPEPDHKCWPIERGQTLELCVSFTPCRPKDKEMVYVI